MSAVVTARARTGRRPAAVCSAPAHGFDASGSGRVDTSNVEHLTNTNGHWYVEAGGRRYRLAYGSDGGDASAAANGMRTAACCLRLTRRTPLRTWSPDADADGTGSDKSGTCIGIEDKTGTESRPKYGCPLESIFSLLDEVRSGRTGSMVGGGLDAACCSAYTYRRIFIVLNPRGWEVGAGSSRVAHDTRRRFSLAAPC
ncbi:hypothetical protein EVAR_79352_1 [Eumeta japonica]|uniref:Uncharacterized protein n=1 Tax=Eumeta variegata TaxID=151549 RepID=A0A4C1THH2_EUMVA|nr:hypothetical protein EVAR_79352_1 [Eumeta japonica]